MTEQQLKNELKDYLTYIKYCPTYHVQIGWVHCVFNYDDTTNNITLYATDKYNDVSGQITGDILGEFIFKRYPDMDYCINTLYYAMAQMFI